MRSGSIPQVNVVQILLRLEQRIRGRTGEVSHEMHSNQSSPSWNLNKICTSYEIPVVSFMVDGWWFGKQVIWSETNIMAYTAATCRAR